MKNGKTPLKFLLMNKFLLQRYTSMIVVNDYDVLEIYVFHARVVSRTGLFGSGSGRVWAGFGPGLGLKSTKISGLIRA